MDAKAILDSLLEKSQQATQAGMQMAEDKGVIPPAGDSRTAMLKGMGAGALAAGAVALFFGSKSTRKFSKKALKVGGTAAIGGLAYKAYTDWQAQNNSAPPADTGTPIAELKNTEATARSEAIVRAMISAARADGHIDELEQAHITRQIENLGLEKDVTQFLLAEMGKPVDVQRIASLADSPEAAAEMYIASALVADGDNPEERRYLDTLATAMGLSPDMVRHLEAPLNA